MSGHVSARNSPLVLSVCKLLETQRRGSVVSVFCLLPFGCLVNAVSLEVPALFHTEVDESVFESSVFRVWVGNISGV